jgi:hypothetical protein
MRETLTVDVVVSYVSIHEVLARRERGIVIKEAESFIASD